MKERILITGASSGIGAALSRAYAKEGKRLVLTGRNENALVKLKKELEKSTEVEIFAANLREKIQREALLNFASSFDILINNAGLGFYGYFFEEDEDSILNILETNVIALIDLSKKAIQRWIAEKREGTILNVASLAGVFPMPKVAVYGASKAFIISFSKALDFECKPYGIRVLTSLPGPVDTQFAKRAVRREEEVESPFAITSERAASEIIQQIKRKKRIHVIHPLMRLGALLGKIMPETLVEKIIYKNIEKRESK